MSKNPRGAAPPPSPVEAEIAFLSELAAAGRLPAYLGAWGETGTPHVACACVLANHLWRRLGVAIEISYRRSGNPLLLEVLDEHASPLAAVPKALARFVEAFDRRLHPELEVPLDEQEDGGVCEPADGAAALPRD